MGELIRMKKISKSFGRINALDSVDFKINEKETIGLVGDNGAGKTTLIKIICGVLKPDSGKIYLQNKEIQIKNVKTAMKLGIEVIHQNLALIDVLPIAENIFLAREPFTKIGLFKFINRKRMKEQSRKILEQIGFFNLDPDTRIQTLSGGERQSISIARCMYFKAKLVIMDEPTTHLSVREAEHVLDFIKRLKKEGISVIVISHNIDEIYQVADKFVFLERGVKIGELNKKKTTPEEIKKIVSRRITKLG